MKRTTKVLSLLTAILLWHESSAFLDASSIPQHAFSLLENNNAFSVPTTVSIGSSPLEHADPFPFLSSLQIADSSIVQAEVFSDLAHVALDFTGMLSPSKSYIRLFAMVFGRVFALSADYLPDHAIHPEELMIQVFFLCLAMRELLQEKVFPSSTIKNERT